MKKTLITVAITAICFGITACGNVEVSSSARPETTTTTSAVVTTAPEQSATVAQSDVDATTTSLPQTTVTTTAPVVTTTPEQVTTTTAATTKTTEKKTSTTTKKVTTTTKKATTTAKPKPVTTTKKVTTTTKKVTTTAKKVTTTAPKTTTKKVTTTTKPTAKLTQSDVDKLVKELQAYSNSKETDVRNNLATVYNYFGGLCKTPEDYYKLHIADATPSNSSWSPTTAIDPDYTYEQAYNFVKGAIDFEYATSPECHVVVYAKWCPNGQGATDGVQRSHWEVYCLR